MNADDVAKINQIHIISVYPQLTKNGFSKKVLLLVHYQKIRVQRKNRKLFQYCADNIVEGFLI